MAAVILEVAREWWVDNGWNPGRWDGMPFNQKVAIALDAKRREWPGKKDKRERNKEGLEQLSLF